MKGKVLDYSFFNNSGNLITDDGDQYEFSGNIWNEQPSPKAGDIVKVTLSNTGMVDSILYLNSSNPPSLPGGYNSTKTDSSSNTYPISEQEKISLNIKYIKEDDYNFWDWMLEGLGNFANLRGRARRKEFWYFYLASRMFMIVASIFPSEIFMLILLLLIIPEVSVTARRLHDIGRSGLWLLMFFIPLLGWAVLFFFLCKDTSPQNNKWGPPARRIH